MEPDATTKPPRKVLLATDLSARCDRALDRAAALAKGWDARLIVVHALEREDSLCTPDTEWCLPSWRRRDPVRTVEAELRRDLAPVPDFTVIVEKAEPTDLILRTAQNEAADLVVTGLARDEMLGRYGLGATVDDLLRRPGAPLLVVKQRLRGPYAKIVVATDFSELSRHALRTVAAFFPDAKLDIFHAFDDPKAGLVGDPEQREAAGREAATSAALAFLAGAGLPDERQRGVGVVVEKGYPAEVLPQYVRDRGVDLVVLGRTGRSALFDLFLGSIAKDMLSALPCDVLVVREPLATATA